MLAERLTPLSTPASPCTGPIPPAHTRDAHWVRPQLVIEVAFAEWTRDNRLRAPSYQGLRHDKDPAEVVREP